MLAPFAPHTAEELWEQYGHHDTLASATLAARSIAEAAKAEEIVIPVQVNGKLRGRLTVAPDIGDAGARTPCAGRAQCATVHRRARR